MTFTILFNSLYYVHDRPTKLPPILNETLKWLLNQLFAFYIRGSYLSISKKSRNSVSHYWMNGRFTSHRPQDFAICKLKSLHEYGRYDEIRSDTSQSINVLHSSAWSITDGQSQDRGQMDRPSYRWHWREISRLKITRVNFKMHSFPNWHCHCDIASSSVVEGKRGGTASRGNVVPQALQ